MSLLTRIDEWARRIPEHVVHGSEAGTLTWGELARRSDALAGAIASAGLRAASPIVVRGHKEQQLLVGFLGCFKAGHPYVPIDDGTPEARAARVIAASGAELVLT